MSDEHCIGCATVLLEIDKDPNGRQNSTCKRCIAEEGHDFDVEPDAVFSRMGERTDTPKAWVPPAQMFTDSQNRPARRYVQVSLLAKWEKLLANAEFSDSDVALKVVSEIRSTILGKVTGTTKQKGDSEQSVGPDVTEQRDKLLAALEALLEHEGTVDSTGIGEFPSEALGVARAEALAVITEVKGK